MGLPTGQTSQVNGTKNNYSIKHLYQSALGCPSHPARCTVVSQPAAPFAPESHGKYKKRNMKRSKWIHIRLTETEYNTITNAFQQTICQKRSEYARKKLLDKPITIYIRSKSVDELTMHLIRIRSELSAIGNNYNQVIRKLHTAKDVKEIEAWLIIHEQARHSIVKKIEETKTTITTLFEKWSP
jgi:hypothetical protein